MRLLITRSMRFLALVLLLGAAMARVVVEAADFALPGPCSIKSWNTKLPTPTQLPQINGLPKTLAANITLPELCAAALPFGTPFPVLFFFNGFMVGGRVG